MALSAAPGEPPPSQLIVASEVESRASSRSSPFIPLIASAPGPPVSVSSFEPPVSTSFSAPPLSELWSAVELTTLSL